jgi:hypothetical protein
LYAFLISILIILQIRVMGTILVIYVIRHLRRAYFKKFENLLFSSKVGVTVVRNGPAQYSRYLFVPEEACSHAFLVYIRFRADCWWNTCRDGQTCAQALQSWFVHSCYRKWVFGLSTEGDLSPVPPPSYPLVLDRVWNCCEHKAVCGTNTTQLVNPQLLKLSTTCVHV